VSEQSTINLRRIAVKQIGGPGAQLKVITSLVSQAQVSDRTHADGRFVVQKFTRSCVKRSMVRLPNTRTTTVTTREHFDMVDRARWNEIEVGARAALVRVLPHRKIGRRVASLAVNKHENVIA
jgi:hypothetical protein